MLFTATNLKNLKISLVKVLPLFHGLSDEIHRPSMANENKETEVLTLCKIQSRKNLHDIKNLRHKKLIQHL